MVITAETYKQIRKMRLQGKSQRQIAASLQISRNTVKKYWDGDSVPWERKAYSREPSVLTEEVMAFVRALLGGRCPQHLETAPYRKTYL